MHGRVNFENLMEMKTGFYSPRTRNTRRMRHVLSLCFCHCYCHLYICWPKPHTIPLDFA